MTDEDEVVGCDTELLDWFHLSDFADLSIALSRAARADVWFPEREGNPGQGQPDDTGYSLAVSVYEAGVLLRCPMTIRHFLEMVLEQRLVSEPCGAWTELEERVFEVEGVRVGLSRTPFAPGKWKDWFPEEYGYVRAASDSTTVARWRRSRLEANRPYFNIEVHRPDGSVVPGQTRMLSLRRSWADQPPLNLDCGTRVREVAI